jgi:TorA maturation chaperone TorD
MNRLSPKTLRCLGHFWLEEVRLEDAEMIASLPGLAAALPNLEPAALTDLAVEYQRLFGFNLPAYESVFVDPSAMLMAPATGRVQRLYRQAGWTPPAGVRTGAPDHLGLEFLALADALDAEQTDFARRLQVEHLAVWVPPLMFSLRRLEPHPFYRTLSSLTLHQLLATLPEGANPSNTVPCSNSPSPAISEGQIIPLEKRPAENEEGAISLHDIVHRLLTPCEAGLFLTRADIGRLSHMLDLPPLMGERQRMLENLFRLAGQYDLVTRLFERLAHILNEARAVYQGWATDYPAWTASAQAWVQRLSSLQSTLAELRTVVAQYST